VAFVGLAAGVLVAFASITVALLVTPLQSVSTAGQTVRVGAAAPTLSAAGPGELDLFGQRLPTAIRFLGPVRPRLPLNSITLNQQLATLPSHPVILDGTLISSDRCSDKKTSRKGMEIDKWHSGKAHGHADLAQGLIAPDGAPLWISSVLPGSTRAITASGELVLPGLRPYLRKIPCLADSGYEGAGAGVLVPVKKPRKGDLDVNTKTRNILLRGPVTRANAVSRS
jgi:hypothetical protein